MNETTNVNYSNKDAPNNLNAYAVYSHLQFWFQNILSANIIVSTPNYFVYLASRTCGWISDWCDELITNFFLKNNYSQNLIAISKYFPAMCCIPNCKFEEEHDYSLIKGLVYFFFFLFPFSPKKPIHVFQPFYSSTILWMVNYSFFVINDFISQCYRYNNTISSKVEKYIQM